MPVRYAFLDHPGPIAFAHRGGAKGHPENSLPAFQRAVDLGYRYLETDVHATADGVLVAFHDRTLDRATDMTGAIATLPYEKVALARVDGREPIPRLEDILGSWPRARVNIDIKDEPAIEPLLAVLDRTGAWERVCVTSFSTRRLDRFRAQVSARTELPVCTTLGPRGIAALRAQVTDGRHVAPDGTVRGAACAQVPKGFGRVPFVTAGFIERAHALGLPVHVWTVNRPAEMDRLLDLGVDGIFTDDLVALRHTMAARGLWH